MLWNGLSDPRFRNNIEFLKYFQCGMDIYRLVGNPINGKFRYSFENFDIEIQGHTTIEKTELKKHKEYPYIAE